MHEIDRTVAELAATMRDQCGGWWSEHPDQPVADWREEVSNDDTRLGYWEWVVTREVMEVMD